MHVCHEDCGKSGPVHEFEGEVGADRLPPSGETNRKALAHGAPQRLSSPAERLKPPKRR
jgi:hypothetical protein